VNNELEIIWKEAFVAKFVILSLRLPGATDENHEKPSVRVMSPDGDLNLGPPNAKKDCCAVSYLYKLFISLNNVRAVGRLKSVQLRPLTTQ
jgi:hypothetical protein